MAELKVEASTRQEAVNPQTNYLNNVAGTDNGKLKFLINRQPCMIIGLTWIEPQPVLECGRDP